MRKQLIRLILLFSLAMSSTLFAQSKKQFEISTNPFGLILGHYQLNFQYAMTDKWTIYLEGGYINQDINLLLEYALRNIRKIKTFSKLLNSQRD